MTITDSIQLEKTVSRMDLKRAPFGHIPADDSFLFYVPTGLNPVYALGKAQALESAVKDMLSLGVQGGMDSNLAYLCELALDAAGALRAADELSLDAAMALCEADKLGRKCAERN